VNRRGQIAIFVIIALVLVAGVGVYLAVNKSNQQGGESGDFSVVYEFYEQCIQDESRIALDIAGSHGGYIQQPLYKAGSEYAPFSSHLSFAGINVPYWSYISANGLEKESVPTLSNIEDSIESYLENILPDSCSFDAFREQGLEIDADNSPDVNVNIENNNVRVSVDSAVSVRKDESSSRKNRYDLVLPSNFGSLYSDAKTIYEKERKDYFLENYSIDVLRLYAPVDGVEISCSPKIWKSREVVNSIQEGLSANIGALTFEGEPDSSNAEKYFIIKKKISNDANLLYIPEWPMRVEIAGADDELMIAEPVGNQEGLGVLGFCYSPYHFVYDLSFPVMVQVSKGNEMFQFPTVVVIDNNLPREGEFSELEGEQESFDLCEFKTQEVKIDVHNVDYEAVNSKIDYSCFDQKCIIGETRNGSLTGLVPSCLNGRFVVRAEGYSTKEYQFSSNSERFADIIIDREYPVNIKLSMNGRDITGSALVNLDGPVAQSTIIPDGSEIILTEGLYNISVYVYSNSSIVIPESTKSQCQEVARGGFFGLFGGTREECFDIKIPETKIDYALSGGGKTNYYFLPENLEKGTIKIEVDSLNAPSTIEELHENYISFDNLNAEVVL